MLAALIIAFAAHSTEVQPPPRAVRYCMTYVTECADSAPATYDASESVLTAVNRAVNSEIRPPQPEETAAVYHDPWTLRPRVGACADYAITKRHDLALRGVPPSAMALAWAHVRNSPPPRYHLVLLVRTSSRTLVLDNLTPLLYDIEDDRLVYDFVSQQDWGHPTRWISVP